MSKVSRRSVLKGLVAGALVLGFDPTGRSWITEAHATVPFTHLPSLDGVLSTNPADLAASSNDWGHMVHRTPVAVLYAESVNDVVKMVNYCRANGIKIAGRGAGHTAFGQSQSAGLVINLSGLDQIHSINKHYAEVGPGVIWSDLLEETVEQGRTPPVLTDYINLTVGGTLSVGGIGGMSFQWGVQVDNVEELTVVTGAGQLLTCSQTKRRDLFDAALAGLGMCAIIVRIKLQLVKAQDRARTYKLFYGSVTAMLNDMRILVNRNDFDYLRGTGAPSPNGWGWYIEATRYYTHANKIWGDDDDDDDDDCRGHRNDHGDDPLQGLHFTPSATLIEDRTYLEYCNLTNQVFESLEPFGLNAMPHPWLDLFVPGSVMNAFTTATLNTLDTTAYLPGSVILFFAFRKSLIKQPMFRVPNEEIFFLFDILPTVPPDPSVVNAVLQKNRSLYVQNRALGGTHYTISAVSLTPADWKLHFGSYWLNLALAKQIYDPAGILGAGTNVFS